jgi:23S rRNA pseudouridine2605 synthase
VTVDGKVVRELGTRVDPEQSNIAVDGERIKLERMVYYAVNKPKGYVSTNDDPAGRPRVVDLLPEVPERVYSVGRLDEDSTGLMILTNDGELANRLAHPRYGVEKTYRALVAGSPPPDMIRKLTEGIWLSDGKVRAKRARVVGSQGEATLLELVLAEGKKREIRRMLAKLGHKVMGLTRIAIGPVVLKGLPAGEHRPLSRAEVELLRKVAAGIEVSPPRFATQGGRDARDHKGSRDRGPRRAEGRPPRAEGRRDRPPAAGDRRQDRTTGSGPPKRLPGKPLPGKPTGGKPIPGKPLPGKPVEAGPGLGGDRPKRLPGNRPAPRPGKPAPPRVPDAGDARPADTGPRRRIIGLAPKVMEQAGLPLSGKPPRKRPGLRRKPPRRAFGIRRPGEDGGADES